MRLKQSRSGAKIVNKVLTVVIRAKNAMKAELQSAGATIKSFGKSAQKAFLGIFRFARKAAISIGLVSAAIGAAGKHFIGLASDAEEIDTKFAAVYKETLVLARVMSSDLAKSFDLAGSTANQMLADTGDLLTGFGFTGAEALKMADKVNRLAIDLASFTNYSKGAAGASQALTKMLLGETEQAKSLGIVVRQGSAEYKDAVAAKMRDLGVSTLQAKAMTALEMAMKQSKNAIGDYARTQDGVANRTRKATEAIKEAKEEIGFAIIENANYAEVLELIAEKAKYLTESGYITLWAEDARTAIEKLIPKAKQLGGALGTTLDIAMLGNIERMVDRMKKGGPIPEIKTLKDLIDVFMGRFSDDEGTDAAAAKRSKRLADIKAELALKAKAAADADKFAQEAALRDKDDRDAAEAAARAARAAAAAKKELADADQAYRNDAAEQAKRDWQQQRKDAEENAAAKAEIEQKMADKKAEYIAEEKRLKAEAFSDEIGQKKKLLEKAEEVAKMSIDAIIQGAKDKKKADKEAEDVAAKAARLLKEEARMAQPMGGRLGRKDRDFLDAWRKQQAAIGQAGKLRGELQVAEDNLAALTNNGKTLVQLLAEWKLMAVDLKKNLQMG